MNTTGDEDIHIEKIKVKDLQEYASKIYAASEPSDVLPITKHLALAHANNPYASPDDVGLVVLTVNGKVAGHIGAVPGLLRNGDSCSKVSYPSSLYLDQRFRGRGLGKKIMGELVSLPVDLITASLSEDSIHVMSSLGVLGGVGPRTDVLMDLRRLRSKGRRAISTVLGRGRPDDALASWVVKVQSAYESSAYPLVRRMFYRALQAVGPRCPRDLAFDEGDHIPEHALEGDDSVGSPRLHRGVDWINWRLSYPWVLGFDDTTDRYENYHFRAVQPAFRVFAVNLHDRKTSAYRGFVVLSVSETETETTLKVLENRFVRPGDELCLTRIISKYGRQYGVDRVFLGSGLAQVLKNNRIARSFLVPTDHVYLTHSCSENSPLAEALNDFQLDPCDGEFCFT